MKERAKKGSQIIIFSKKLIWCLSRSWNMPVLYQKQTIACFSLVNRIPNFVNILYTFILILFSKFDSFKLYIFRFKIQGPFQICRGSILHDWSNKSLRMKYRINGQLMIFVLNCSDFLNGNCFNWLCKQNLQEFQNNLLC